MKKIVFTSLTDALQKDWVKLWKHSPFANYTNSPYWFLSIRDAFEYTNYQILAVYADDQLRAIVPLIREKRGGVPCYTLPPGDFVCGIPFLLDAQDPEIMHLVVTYLASLDVVVLDNIPEAFVALLQKQTTKIGAIQEAKNYFMQISSDGTGRIVVPHRSVLMRRAKSEVQKFRLQAYDGTTLDGLQIAFAIDLASSKHHAGYNIFSDEQIKNFYKRIATYFKKNFCVNILYYADVPIAYEIGFLIKKTYFGSQVAFSSAYAKYDPGKVIAVSLLEQLARWGVQTVDFGSGDSHIKRLLTKDSRVLCYIVFAKNPLSKQYLLSRYSVTNYLFNTIHTHRKIYKCYRTIQKMYQAWMHKKSD